MRDFSSFWEDLKKYKKPKKVRLGFSDFSDDRVQTAVKTLDQDGLVEPCLLTPPQFPEKNRLFPNEDAFEEGAQALLEAPKSFIKSLEEARNYLKTNTLCMGIAALRLGKLDGLLSGSLLPSAEVVHAAIKLIGPKKGHWFVFGQFLMETITRRTANNGPFLFTDCAVVPDPSPRILGQIAQEGAAAYQFFTEKDPKVALLSFSTRGSAEHPFVDKIREGLKTIDNQHNNWVFDGEIQLDAALDANVAQIKKAQDSDLAGQSNVLIFPNLESGNIGYKLVQRFANARVAGPFLWGLEKPMSDLSRGCSVQEIIDTAYAVRKMILKGN